MLSAAAALVLSSVSLPSFATYYPDPDPICPIAGECSIKVEAVVRSQCECSFGNYNALDFGKLDKYHADYGKDSTIEDMTILCNTATGGTLSASSVELGLDSEIDYELFVSGNSLGNAFGNFGSTTVLNDGLHPVQVKIAGYNYNTVLPGAKDDQINFLISPL